MTGDFQNRFSFVDGGLSEIGKVPEVRGEEEAPSLNDLKSRLQDIFSAESDRSMDNKTEMAEDAPFDWHHQDFATLEDGTVIKLPETEAASCALGGSAEKLSGESIEDQSQSEGLSEEEKEQIRKETGWSDEIIDAIGSMEEYEIYKNAGLVEAEIDGKKCLIRNDIDWNQKDAKGRTNRERASQGLPPYNKDGKTIELHHIGQHADSPLAELTPEEHRGKGNDSILHDKTKASEIDRQAFARERNEHWEARAGQEN